MTHSTTSTVVRGSRLGADASVAAGPIGRNAEDGTDLRMRAEILSYSRSRGIFAGISLEGASLRQDTGANLNLYGVPVSPRSIPFGPSDSPTRSREEPIN